MESDNPNAQSRLAGPQSTARNGLNAPTQPNDPYDRESPIVLLTPQLIPSREYMRSIRNYSVPRDAFAVWYLGQNGFILKDALGPLIGIDLYLTNSCAKTFAHLPFRLDRQLPIFIEPEDLDIDVFVTTHSHEDHADPETLRRLSRTDSMTFVGPFDSMRVFRECAIEESLCKLVHPGQTLQFGSTRLQATFALPTDDTDLNHTGMLVEFANGLTLYNSGDTAWAERLPSLLPTGMDVCTICINGGFHNLMPNQAAAIAHALAPRIVIPCHYDMMVNNVGSPEMFRVALDLLQSKTKFIRLPYYEPWLYQRH